MYISLHVKYPLLLWDFTELRIFSADFLNVQYPGSKFHDNPSCGSRVVPHEGRQADMTKLIVASRSFAYAPKVHLYTL